MPLSPFSMPRPKQGEQLIPEWTRDPKAWWAKLTPAEKEQFLSNLGEAGGGTAGSIVGGGWMSIPGAGAGAVIGRNTALGIAKAVGVELPKRTGAEEAKVQLGTFARNATGEGVGRALPFVARAAKTGAGNAVRRAFQPTQAAKELKALADAAGIKLTLGQRSGNTWVQNIEVALERSPYASDKMRQKYLEQYRGFEKQLNDILDQYHAGSITPEDFARTARATLETARTKLNQRMEKAVSGAAKSLHPTPVSNLEAGVAQKEGLEANVDAIRQWADKEYNSIHKDARGAVVDMGPYVQRASALIEGIPEGQLHNLLPPKTLNLVKAAQKASSQGTESVMVMGESVSPAQLKERFPDLYAEMFGEAGVPVTVPFADAIQIRKQLLNLQRGMPREANPIDKRVVGELASGIDEAMEKSLEGTPSYERLRAVNAQFRELAQRTRPPAAKGKPGNRTAQTIYQSEKPEQLPGQIVKPGAVTTVRQSVEATSPRTVAGIADTAGMDEPLHQLRRNRMDAVVEDATVRDPATGQSHISPEAYGNALERTVGPVTAPELFGGRTASVTNVAKPKLVARERRLFKTPFAKAVDTGDSNRVMSEAFPRREPEAAKDALGLMSESGDSGKARRAFLENVVDESRTQNPIIGDERFVDPRKLERNLSRSGETADVVSGPTAAPIEDAVALGKGVTSENFLYQNASGTARGNEAQRVKRHLYNPLDWARAAKENVIDRAAARVATNPNAVESLTAPLKPIPTAPGDMFQGAMGRIPFALRPLPQQDASASFDPDKLGFAPIEEQFDPIKLGFTPLR